MPRRRGRRMSGPLPPTRCTSTPTSTWGGCCTRPGVSRRPSASIATPSQRAAAIRCSCTTSASCWRTWTARTRRWRRTKERCTATRASRTAITTSRSCARSSTSPSRPYGTWRNTGDSPEPSRIDPGRDRRPRRAVSGRLPLDEFPHCHPGGFGPVEVAHGIRDHAFADALGLGLRAQAWNESSDRAVPHAADPDAPLEAGIELRIRLVIGHVNRVVPVDEDPARPAELLPLFEEIPFLVEDLDAAVAAVADEQPSPGIQGDGVRRVELAGGGPFLAPGLDEFPVRREFHDARVGIPAVSVRDKDVAVRSGDDVRRPVEGVRTVPGDSGLAEGQQDLSVGAELDDLVTFSVFSIRVRDPHIAATVHMDAVRKHEHPRAKGLEDLARWLQLDHGRYVRTGAGVRAAPLEDPDVAAAIDIDRARLSPLPSVGEFRPAVLAVVLCVGSRTHRDDRCGEG